MKSGTLRKCVIFLVAFVMVLSMAATASAGFNLGGILGGVVKGKPSGGSNSGGVTGYDKKNYRTIYLTGQCDLKSAQIVLTQANVNVTYDAVNQELAVYTNTTYEAARNAKVTWGGEWATDKDTGTIKMKVNAPEKYVKGFIWSQNADHYFTFNVNTQTGGELQLVRHAGKTYDCREKHTDS